MNRIFKVFLFLLAFNISFACFAKDAQTPIKVFHLKNGQTVVIKEVHANPIVTIDTWVKTGSADENDKNNGISHFLEHLIFKGTNTHKTGEIEKILEARGARCNAATSKDFTHFYITIASNYVNTALKLHADMMQNPIIPQKEMDKERKVVENEIRRAEDNPQSSLFNNLFKLMFKEHPYRRPTLGSIKNIENITRSQALNYFHKRYSPSSFITVVVGDVDTQKILSLIKTGFNSKNKSYIKTVNTVPKREPTLEKPAIKIKKGDYKSGYLFMGFKGVPITSIKEGYALDMAASILGGSETSRLYQDLKEKQNLVSSIGAEHYSLKDDSVFLISADFSPEKYQAVKTAILKEIENFRNNPVSKEELDRAKTLAKRGFIYGNESVENIAESIGNSMVMSGSIKDYKEHIRHINEVTAKDIQKAAKKYLVPSRFAMSALLPKEIKVNNVTTNKITIKNSTRSELSNGSVLITNKNTSNDIISMSVFFRGGKYLEPKPGTADLLAKTLLYGTKTRPYEKLIKEIEDSGISISPSASADCFEITLKSTKNDFDKAFGILTDIIKNPTFKEKYIEKNKEDILTSLKKAKDRPLTVASENFIVNLYKNHPYGHAGTVLEKNIPDITREDVVNYWSKVFIPENMIVSVAGNIDNDKMARKLIEAFQTSEKTPPVANYSHKFTPLDKNIVINTNYDSSAAWILMGWPVGNVNNNKELASFKVINAILSGGLSSRLFKTFRENQALAYSVGSSYSPNMDRGHFVLYIGTEPKYVKLVKQKFLKEIDRLKTQPLTKEELTDAKSKIIGRYKLSQETNQSKAHLLGKLEVVDKKFGFNYDFPDLINKVTAEDVMNTANKYFNYPYVLSVVGPQKESHNFGKE